MFNDRQSKTGVRNTFKTILHFKSGFNGQKAVSKKVYVQDILVGVKARLLKAQENAGSYQ